MQGEGGVSGGCRSRRFVRSATEEERQALTLGLRSEDAFSLRRCQIIFARPHTSQADFAANTAEQLRTLPHREPRGCGYPTGVWPWNCWPT